MEYADGRAVGDECGIGAALQNSREFRTIENIGISINASTCRCPNSPGDMHYLVLIAASVALRGIAPVMLGDELFQASLFWLDGRFWGLCVQAAPLAVELPLIAGGDGGAVH